MKKYWLWRMRRQSRRIHRHQPQARGLRRCGGRFGEAALEKFKAGRENYDARPARYHDARHRRLYHLPGNPPAQRNISIIMLTAHP